eukprot:TRINITY_DN44179_c0_g1_i1.p1 TRINITY_DN44179_c0_g1~~TRINITY_DN44179_c0_g1_i1.p1  ORF type:complete len:467 (+),score=62.49 TRINITY_DN44179_c0_g1_i1:145-1401(+)
MMDRYYLPNGTGAVCIDGSPGVYYFAPAANPEHANKWVMFFEGGGWCYNEVDCYHRSFTGLGSSSTYPSQHDGGDAPDSHLCKVNPTFCEYNRVWLPYCDGNSFSGDREDPVVVRGKPLYFRGHRILQTVLHELTTHHNLNAVTHFFLTGCSAGGLATFIHTNFVGDYLGSVTNALILDADEADPAVRARHAAIRASDHSPRVLRYGSAPLSGFFLNHPNVADVPVYFSEIMYIAGLSAARSGLDQRCVTEAVKAGDDWRSCNFAAVTYTRAVFPIFPINSKFDAWQTACILGSVLPPNFPNQTGSENGMCDQATPTYHGCDSKPYTNCSKSEKDMMVAYQASFDATLRTSSTYSRRGNGAFIYNKHTHCYESAPVGWDNTRVRGVLISDAVAKWWATPGAPATENTHHCDAFYPDAC